MKKKIAILGATGSIGKNAVDVVLSHPDELQAVALSALSSREECEALARKLGAKAFVGEDSAIRAVEESDADLCLVATVGASGLKPTLAAIEKGMDVALATKEVLVMAGEIVMERVRRRGVSLTPVDSEHSAIFQCLQPYGCGAKAKGLSKLTLTASGGPFLDSPKDLSSVTPDMALSHPRWKMGPKVTVDSATMVNKGFEIIEARWLFDVPPGRISVVVHPESVVHSLVTFDDGATLAQLSPPDMRIAIQYALLAPNRVAAVRESLDLARLGSLTFREPDESRFPCLAIARESLRIGGLAPAALSLADESAVRDFLEGRIRFTDIPAILEKAIEKPETWTSSLQQFI